MIRQGDIYWLDLGVPRGSAPGYRHPHVVVQNNLLNQSPINTAIVCAITSNLMRARIVGNVLLNKGEADLPKPSVVSVTQIMTVDKSDLVEKIGTLSSKRVLEILEGIQLVLQPREVRAGEV